MIWTDKVFKNKTTVTSDNVTTVYNYGHMFNKYCIFHKWVGNLWSIFKFFGL